MNSENNLFESLCSENEVELISFGKSENQKILCEHCKRTANNGIKCIGRCVADNEY